MVNFQLFQHDLQHAERTHEMRLQRHKQSAPLKLRWRALGVKHFLHIVPGERILELGAGTGQWTRQLASVLDGENPITAVVFSPELVEKTPSLPNVEFITASDFEDRSACEQFDYVIGSGTLSTCCLPDMLAATHKLLKPGGQIFFFDRNSRNPLARILAPFRPPSAAGSHSSSYVRMLQACSATGYTHVEISPYDLVPWGLTQQAAERFEAKAILLEHAPLVRAFTDSQYLSARKPGVSVHRRTVQLANHESLRDTVSVVIPCYNEASNIGKVTDRLLAFYGLYIHEILVVNDNSTDATESVTRQLSKAEPRIKLINRSKPNGVGRALADGYRAATGKYILSMDCDFVEILPEFRGLFDVIAEGHDGAIGSRFSHESVVLNYPFSKMLCNRLFHVAIKFLLIRNVRDVSNNLKLYRAEILKSLAIESPHFSANLETGLKPLLAGYDICEVPISWINRTTGMGKSSFNLKKVGGDYVRALIHIWKTHGSAPNAILRRATGWGGVTRSHPTVALHAVKPRNEHSR